MGLDTNIQRNEGTLIFSVTKHMTLSTKTTHSYTLLAGLCIFSHNRFVSILAIIPVGCVLYNKCSQLSR